LVDQASVSPVFTYVQSSRIAGATENFSICRVVKARRAGRQTSAQPGRAGVSIIAIPSAVGAALLSSQHICGIVRYTGLFQQRQELLFERHILVVFALTADVGSDLVELRNTHAEGALPVLPLKHEATFVQESR
jgi:hypothetical protein